MGVSRLQYFVVLFLLSGIVEIVWCQGCGIPPCRDAPCGVGGPNCPSPCQCTLFAGVGKCTSCAGELCKCSNAMGSARQLCCKGLSCVQPNRMPAIGDGQCRNLAKGI